MNTVNKFTRVSGHSYEKKTAQIFVRFDESSHSRFREVFHHRTLSLSLGDFRFSLVRVLEFNYN